MLILGESINATNDIITVYTLQVFHLWFVTLKSSETLIILTKLIYRIFFTLFQGKKLASKVFKYVGH